jgi:hypothetical protein
MVIEGRIVHVMETWPLQLVVQSSAGRYEVSLLEETRVLRHDREVSHGELRPGLRVEISGPGEGRTMRAESIRIA